MGCQEDNCQDWPRARSELVAQRKLHLSRAINGAKDCSERAICRSSVRSAEHVAVECVNQISLQRQVLGFGETPSFYDREVLVDVSLTSDLSRYPRHIPKHKSALGHQAGGIRVEERCTIEVGGYTSRCTKSSVRVVLGATRFGTSSNGGCRRVKGRSSRTEQGLAWNTI